MIMQCHFERLIANTFLNQMTLFRLDCQKYQLQKIVGGDANKLL